MEIDCNSDMDDNIDEIVSIVESSNGSDGREADAIISGKIEKSTRNLYAKKNAVLLRWLQDKYPLHVREDNSIIVPLPVDIVKKYFAHVTKKKNGKNCAYSTVAGFKSAMQDLYSSHGCEDAFLIKLRIIWISLLLSSIISCFCLFEISLCLGYFLLKCLCFHDVC